MLHLVMFSAIFLAVTENVVLCGYKIGFRIHVTLCSTCSTAAGVVVKS